jgi:hypothetical protein
MFAAKPHEAEQELPEGIPEPRNVTMAPEKTEDALAVLRLAAELVTDFLVEDEPTQKPALTVVRIGGDEGA